jgi:hypothetical protein
MQNALITPQKDLQSPADWVDVDDIVRPPPRAGTGVHFWLFGQACQLKDAGATPEEAELYIRASLDEHEPGRDVPARELNEAVRNAFSQAQRPDAIAWPKSKAKEIKEIVEGAKAFTLAKLKEHSPEQNPGNLTAESALDILFPGNPLLCLAPCQSEARTFEREKWRGLENGLQFTVPSPMSKPFGTTQDGRKSARCLDNVGARRFLVVEFDMTPKSEFWVPLIQRWEKKRISIFDAQASLLVDLATNRGLRAPLACVVHSGNKSLQGWFYVQGFEDERILPFFQRTVSLGADRATWTRCQLVRLPAGLRENDVRQEVVYLNPDVIRKEGSDNGSN